MAGVSLTYSGILSAGLLNSCTTARYVGFTNTGNQLEVSKSELGNEDFVLLSGEDLKAPIYLLRMGEDDYKAIYLLCTHKGCDVKPAGPVLACPCHGSEFTQTGKLLQGPAEKDLMTFPVKTDDDKIYIQIKS